MNEGARSKAAVTCCAPSTWRTRDQRNTKRIKDKPTGTSNRYQNNRARVSRRPERVCCS